MTKTLCQAIASLTRTLCESNELRKNEFEWLKSHSHFATKQDLIEIKDIIMSAISEFAARMNERWDRKDAAINALAADVRGLHDDIAKLQSTPGPISPEDQAILDAMEVRSEEAITHLEEVDAITPPKAGPVDPGAEE